MTKTQKHSGSTPAIVREVTPVADWRSLNASSQMKPDEPEFVRQRKLKLAKDRERRQLHIDFLAGLSIAQERMARSLANEVLDAWERQKMCGAYYISMWRRVVDAENMCDAYVAIPETDAMAMATNSPFLHGFVKNQRIMELVHANT